jgi:hypothetical protein
MAVPDSPSLWGNGGGWGGGGRGYYPAQGGGADGGGFFAHLFGGGFSQPQPLPPRPVGRQHRRVTRAARSAEPVAR